MVTTRSKRKILKTIISQAASTEDTDLQSTHDSTSFMGFNDDLLTEILLRLPAASILLFKSVSKHWLWLLSNRSFTFRFDKLSKSPGIFAGLKYVPFDVKDRSPPFRGLDFHPDLHEDIKILQSCNGLLLCMSGVRFLKYYVLNLTTKQFAIIPSVPGGEVVHRTIRLMTLAFHQTDCVHYKVVCIRKLDFDKTYKIQVYSSDTKEWKTSIESFSPSRPMGLWGKGVYWNGAIYWTYSTVFYKVDVEELHTLPLMVSSEPPYKKYLWESRGHLHLIVHKGGKLFHLNVYEMLSDHSGWFVKYQLQLDEVLAAFRGMIPRSAYSSNMFGYSCGVVDMVRGEKDEDTFLVLLINRELIKYNIHDKSFKQISVLPSKHYSILSGFHRYTEALASI